MMPNDRSEEALRERLELAEKATKGPWIKIYRDFLGEDGFGWESKPTVEAEDKMICLFYDRNADADDVDNDEADAAHIAANSPDVVRADIEEILRLRLENKMLGVANEKLDFQRFLAEKRVQAMLAKGTEGKYVWQHNAENRWCPFNLNRLCPGIGCMAWIPKIDENGREYSDYGRCLRLIGEGNNVE